MCIDLFQIDARKQENVKVSMKQLIATVSITPSLEVGEVTSSSENLKPNKIFFWHMFLKKTKVTNPGGELLKSVGMWMDLCLSSKIRKIWKRSLNCFCWLRYLQCRDFTLGCWGSLHPTHMRFVHETRHTCLWRNSNFVCMFLNIFTRSEVFRSLWFLNFFWLLGALSPKISSKTSSFSKDS